MLDKFEGMRTQVLGISVDSVPCLKAWADSLGGVSYPLLSDFFPHGQVANNFGILREEGYTERAIFVIDKQGIIRYVDVHDIADQPSNDELFCVLAELEPQAAAAQQITAPPPQPEPMAEVVLYCTQWCPGCRRARAYLKEHNIEYVEVDITHDRQAAKRVRGWANGNETTPTFSIKGKIIVDLRLDKLDEALGIK